MRLFYLLLAALVAWTAHDPILGAQAPAEVPVLARVLTRRLDELAADSVVRRYTRARTGLELLREAPLDDIGRLDDGALVQYHDVFRRTLERADERTCAALWDPARGGVTSSGFLGVAAQADSALAVEWTETIERLVWAGLRNELAGERASRAEVDAALATARMTLPAADRDRLYRLSSAASLSEADRCFLVRTVFRGYGMLPRERAGPILRAIVQLPGNP